MTRLSSLALVALLVACSNQVSVVHSEPVDGEGGGGSGSGQGGGGAEPVPQPLSLVSVNAPDEYSVVVRFNQAAPPEALAAASYLIQAPEGALVVTNAVAQDADSIKLETQRQKLGVRYHLAFATGNAELDQLSAEFLSADTAKFWATDFGNFTEYELVADRREVGTYGVIYIEQSHNPDGVAHARDFFDQSIYPIETELFVDAPDMDENGRTVLLGLDGGGYYGGYFSPINSLTDEEAMANWGMHSNEMEIVYINVAQGYFDAEVVLAHEFQHLLYNEQHGFDTNEFAYHNEGLAECAVNAVNGYHPWALDYFVFDPEGEIASGLSLLNWGYGNYDHYVLAYVFLSYLAGQMGGVAAYGDLFQSSGHPDALGQLLQAQIGSTFSQAQFDALIASWAQAPSGKYGFNGVLTWTGKPPTAFDSVSLAPLAGTWRWPFEPSVDYPGTQGPNIVYAGVNGAGDVDLVAPFDVAGGALVVFNQELDFIDPTPEPSGFMPQLDWTAPARTLDRDPAWRHPPPVHPARFAELKRWRDRTAPR